MNQKGNEFFSKVEKKYDLKVGRFLRCPICKQEGKPMEDNPLVMIHKVDDDRAILYHRWSYSTGRIVSKQAEETNIL